MKKYQVDYFYRVSVEVEAEDSCEAREKADEVPFSVYVDNGAFAEYCGFMDPEVFELDTNSDFVRVEA